jgi:hypothetical protein
MNREHVMSSRHIGLAAMMIGLINVAVFGMQDRQFTMPASEKLVELAIELPAPLFESRPGIDIPTDARLDRSRRGKPREPFYTPPSVCNVSQNKPVTSSDRWPIIGDLDLITDGGKEARDERFVELAPGKQWVQIDLKKPRQIYAVAIWHNHMDTRVYRDVVIQLSNDPQFEHGVVTVFNNDHDNTSGLGAGCNFEYFESFEGLLAPVAGVTACYVRCWSNGSTRDRQNHYTEVEVFGRYPKPRSLRLFEQNPAAGEQ